jgi:hypothetical protein
MLRSHQQVQRAWRNILERISTLSKDAALTQYTTTPRLFMRWAVISKKRQTLLLITGFIEVQKIMALSLFILNLQHTSDI